MPLDFIMFIGRKPKINTPAIMSERSVILQFFTQTFFICQYLIVFFGNTMEALL